MSELKHTPGPWRMDDQEQIWHGDDPAEFFTNIFITEVCGSGSTAQDSANAKLIALTPEMYDALLIIASEGKGQFQWSLTKAEALARSVISKLDPLLYVRSETDG